MTNTLKTDPGVPAWEECMEILNSIPQLSISERAGKIFHLFRNPSPGIRQRAIKMGAAVLTDDQLVGLIRNDADDVMRNAGFEILKLKGSQSFLLCIRLLGDSDPDVVLQAILLLDHMRDPRSYKNLRPFLANPDLNLRQVAISAIGHLGSARAVRDLLPFLQSEPWLQMAAVQALGDIRSSQAIRQLQRLLTDLLIGSLAAEAIARIGGARAFSVLAEHWMSFHETLEAEFMLDLLAHVLEGLKKRPFVPEDFLKTVYPYLCHELDKVRLHAARCVLAAGPCEKEGEALQILCDSESGSDELPACLDRPDLIPRLVKMEGLPLIWGLRLMSASPGHLHLIDLINALESDEAAEHLEAVIFCMTRIRRMRMGILKTRTGAQRLGKAIFRLYERLPLTKRALLTPVLKAFGKELEYLLSIRPDMDHETSLVLKSILGKNARAIARSIAGIPSAGRLTVLPQIRSKQVCRNLPWGEWLADDPGTYGPVAARIAEEMNLTELVTPLRDALTSNAHPEIIRCMGEFRDRESVPILMGWYRRSPYVLQSLILETLGKIGGTEARKALSREIAGGHGKMQPLAFRALSRCAAEDDLTIFRAAVAHPDWMVRLACAEAYARFPNAENTDYLTRLASDPMNAVSQRACELLEA